MTKKLFNALAVCLLFLVGCNQNETIEAAQAEPSIIEQNMGYLNNKTPGCGVAVVQGGEVKYEHYFGQSSLRYNVPVDDKTVFRIASISKHFTAALALILADEGKLALSDTLLKYYPEGPAWFADISIYQLIHHRSGLPNYTENDAMAYQLSLYGQQHPKVMTSTLSGLTLTPEHFVIALLDALKTLDKTDVPPGLVTRYTNTGYVLLADVIEKVSEQPIQTLAKEKLFDPLGMTSTRINSTQDGHVPWLATGYFSKDTYYSGYMNYDWGEEQYREVSKNIMTIGPDGVLTTLGDFTIWMNHLMDPKVNPQFWQKFLDINHDEFGDAPNFYSRLNKYSNGLIVQDIRTMPKYAHDGLSYDGMGSEFWFIPEQKLGYVQLCNFLGAPRIDSDAIQDEFI